MELFRENLTEQQVRQYPTLTLAHIGDCVYELLARSHVIKRGVYPVRRTHSETISIVSAEAQHRGALAVVPMLSEEETAVFIRGRNAKPKTVPKHAGLEAYAYATALETLFGYLYLRGNNERISELWQAVIKELEA